MKKTIEITAEREKGEKIVKLTVFFMQDEDVWTAQCKELGTIAFGYTFEEAKQNIKEAIQVHLNILDEVGETERFSDARNI